MTEPQMSDLLELAVPYALHAVSDSERGEIEDRLAQLGGPDADARVVFGGRRYGGGPDADAFYYVFGAVR